MLCTISDPIMFTSMEYIKSNRLSQRVFTRHKLEQSRYRPGVAQRAPGSLKFPDFMTTAQDGSKVISLTHRPHLPPGNAPGTHVC